LERSQYGHVIETPHAHQPYLDVNHAFQQALTVAKLDDIRFHDLRHTFFKKIEGRAAGAESEISQYDF